MTATPYTKDDLKTGEKVVKALHGVRGFEAWAELIAKEVAAERERCAKRLEHEADLLTNSLHCGDSSITIQSTHRWAKALRTAARTIRRSE